MFLTKYIPGTILPWVTKPQLEADHEETDAILVYAFFPPLRKCQLFMVLLKPGFEFGEGVSKMSILNLWIPF